MSDDAARSLDAERLAAEIAEQGSRWRSDPTHRREEAAILEVVRQRVPVPGNDVGLLVEQAERLLALEAYPPIAARPPYVAAAKSAVRRVTFGPLHHLASQVGALGSTLVAAVRELNGRVAHLEQQLDVAVDLPPLPPLPAEAVSRCVEQLAGVPGPVLQVTAGEGELVEALAEAGLEAYGVEPSVDLVRLARRRGRDVRDGSVAHLGALGGAALGGVVLSGVVDILPLGGVVEALRLTHARLRPGGRVVVAAHERASFARHHPVLADLAPGDRLGADTWMHLLAATGFEPMQQLQVETAGGSAAATVDVIVARRCH